MKRSDYLAVALTPLGAVIAFTIGGIAGAAGWLIVALVFLIVAGLKKDKPGLATDGDTILLGNLRDERALWEAVLEVKCGTAPPYHAEFAPGQFRYAVGVYNRGPVAAENVDVSLLRITPRPSDGYFLADYPYRAWPVDRLKLGLPLRINPDQEEFFVLMHHWVSSEPRLIVHGIDTKRGRPDTNEGAFGMATGESWQLDYQVTCANARPHKVSFRAARVADSVMVVPV